MHNSRRWRIWVNGTVQGVGFRPFIYRLAAELRLRGFVCNTSGGVTIEAEGAEESLKSFTERIHRDCPPLARIHEFRTEDIPPAGDPDFTIMQTDGSASAMTSISPDIAPCDDCIAEFSDCGDRRYNYPFINCTNCGPRYSIIERLPYDRPMTTMSAFEMCDACRNEYENPMDRRFHAQPNACGKCGPTLAFIRGSTREDNNPLARALDLISRGGIIAIKGIGGYHLACDAANDDAVRLLRERKRRDEKPFAIMVGDMDSARSLCEISHEEEQLLISPERPIVLLRRKHDAKVSPLIAPGNGYLGLMLPSTPLHHLLFDARRILVMTSGNVTDEPIAYKDDFAFEKLSGIADAFLTHNREIHVRIDDSIARVMDGEPLIIRRARGYVPSPIRLSFSMPQLFAAGADLKNAICLTRGRNAFISQYLGDMENPDANAALRQTASHLMDILGIRPTAIAHDMHPDYFSTRTALAIAKGLGIGPIYPVQHHHAHIASCMAENDLPDEETIGIALDGTGFGPDGAIWGGEILVADYRGFERAAHFEYMPMPGGDIAAREGWRMAIAYLQSLRATSGSEAIPSKPLISRDCFGRLRSLAMTMQISEDKIELIEQMITKDINCPRTSSCGRLFDAVAAILDIRMENSFEGQAAMMLEQIADESETGFYESRTTPARRSFSGGNHESRHIISFAPTISAILEDLGAGTPPSVISMRFHNTIINALTEFCVEIGARRMTHDARRVCLSGGCFQNAILTRGLKKSLVDKGFTVYTHRLVSPNDGGIALGQAAIAAHILDRRL